MKKNILTLIFFACFSTIFAQGLYVGVNAGYALKNASLFYYSSVDANNTEVKPFSMGAGFDAGLNLGYMFNKNVGVELGVSYLLGSKNKIKMEDQNGSSESFYKANMLRLIPSLVIAAGFDKINPYAKFGALIGFGSFKYESEATYEAGYKSTLANTDIYKEKYKGGVALGLYAALGADYNLNEKLALFAELNLESMSYAPTKGEVTEHTINGVDQLANAQTFQKEFEYVKELPHDYDASETPGSPAKELRQKYPFSSIGLNVGVKIRL